MTFAQRPRVPSPPALPAARPPVLRHQGAGSATLSPKISFIPPAATCSQRDSLPAGLRRASVPVVGPADPTVLQIEEALSSSVSALPAKARALVASLAAPSCWRGLLSHWPASAPPLCCCRPQAPLDCSLLSQLLGLAQYLEGRRFLLQVSRAARSRLMLTLSLSPPRWTLCLLTTRALAFP
jgi:hypothetical protein